MGAPRHYSGRPHFLGDLLRWHGCDEEFETALSGLSSAQIKALREQLVPLLDTDAWSEKCSVLLSEQLAARAGCSSAVVLQALAPLARARVLMELAE
jgi:hypothetical protein